MEFFNSLMQSFLKFNELDAINKQLRALVRG